MSIEAEVEKLFDTHEMAKLLNKTENHLSDLARTGRVPAIKKKSARSGMKMWHFKLSDMLRYMEGLDTATTPISGIASENRATRTWQIKLTWEQMEYFAPMFAEKGITLVPLNRTSKKKIREYKKQKGYWNRNRKRGPS
jgi:hypothetical protein